MPIYTAYSMCVYGGSAAGVELMRSPAVYICMCIVHVVLQYYFSLYTKRKVAARFFVTDFIKIWPMLWPWGCTDTGAYSISGKASFLQHYAPTPRCSHGLDIPHIASHQPEKWPESCWPLLLTQPSRCANLPGQVAVEEAVGREDCVTSHRSTLDPWPSLTSEAPAQAALQNVGNLLPGTIKLSVRVKTCIAYIHALQIIG